MKSSKLLLAAACLCGGMAHAQQGKSGKLEFTIKGQLGNVAEPAKVFIIYRNNGMRGDSAEVKNHQFTLSGTAELQQKTTLYLRQGGEPSYSRRPMDQLTIYLENGTIEVTSPDSLQHAKVGGSQLNIDQQDYLNSIGNLKELQAEIIAKYKTETDSVKREELIGDYKQMDVMLQTGMAGFIQSHPRSLVAMHVLRNNFNPSDNVELASNLYNSLSDDIKNSSSGTLYKESIENVYKLAVGKVAPDFAAKDMLGAEKHLSDFRGKYVLLDFWASWCGPCRKESPNLITSYSKFKHKKFEIISFSVDQSADAWKKAVAEDKYTWTNLKDNAMETESVAKLYGVTALPTNLLLDPAGKIVAMNLRGQELEKQLAQILN
ncbi:Peroxiredoxin [Filimonas lacunae]|uniref:Peroxiredoxin n=1 Tax=Filimonas lacunae TaxID=477680 RepID=A0A173MJH0_9BACT|nr:TlpA disulfide reductase family protein [Filimonas lacunae]BAV07538.1 thiol:disulfide interchange protein [Filimonas lacunae]SIT30028.1 Peroxiredoxin [Filimonas lacunae]